MLKNLLLVCLLTFGTGLFLPSHTCAQTGEEYAVKSAFVLNFAKVTRWPESAFTNSAAPLDLCLVGDKHLVDAFRSIDGKQAGERTLQLQHRQETGTFEECEIIYISGDVNRAAMHRVLAAVRERPVLIIGEIANFARTGGIINFTNKKGRLHFEINPQEAERKGIKISSRILQLATIVSSN